MQKAPIPLDDEARLAELERLEMSEGGAEAAYDRVTAELARVFQVPISTMSIIHKDKQTYRSVFGGPEELGEMEVPREVAVCAHVVGSNTLMAVDDLSKDERFADNPMLLEAGARFYAGAPLRGDNGQPIGTLCIIDTKPRHMTERERDLLQMIADGLMKEVKLRKLTRELARISHHLAEGKGVMERDLRQAAAVQQFLLPPELQERERYLVAHVYHPFTHIGGDFVDVHLRADETVVLLLADVSGHGASAAMTAAMTKTSFLRAAERVKDPAELLTRIHCDLGRVIRSGQFITAIAAMFDPHRRTLTLSSAGHPYPILLRGGEARLVAVENEMPLLVEPGQVYGEVMTLGLERGDLLLLYTDGATEASDAHGKLLGMERLREMAGAAWRGEQERGVGFLQRLFAGVHDYAGGQLGDDVAMVGLECR